MIGKLVVVLALLLRTVTLAPAAFAIQLSTWIGAPANALVLAQVDTPKTEAILRKTIQDLQQGKPDFNTMEPELQNAVKDQAQHTADIYRHLGTLQSLKYIGTQGGNVSIGRCTRMRQSPTPFAWRPPAKSACYFCNPRSRGSSDAS